MKRSIKNMVLTFSVLLAFVLVYQIWFNSYLLPDGYRYLTSGIENNIIKPITGFLFPKKNNDFSQNLKALLKPKKVVLQYSGERRAFSDDAAGFVQARKLAETTMQHAMNGEYALKSKETVTMDNYFSTLKGKSVYVDYGKNCDYRLFSYALCGKTKNAFTDDMSVMNGYIISLHDGILNDVSVYMIDQKSQTVYRYVVEAEKNELDTQLKNIMAQSENLRTLSYSFELNFHKEQAESPSKVIFSPMLLLDLQVQMIPSVTSSLVGGAEHVLNDDMLESVLSTFSINTRTMNKYVDLDNARVFIENNATLTVYPNGLLQYQTVQGGRGPDISGGTDKTNYDIYSATANAVDFVTKLCGSLPSDVFEHLQISSALVNESVKQGHYNIYFDYCIDGRPVRCKEGDTYYHTIEIEIENGYLQSYRQILKTYTKYNDEMLTLQPMLSAADVLVDMLYMGDKPVIISTMRAGYVDDLFNGISARWDAVVNGQEYMPE